MTPLGATHVHTFYGTKHYYRRAKGWLYWTGRNWQQAGPGFSTQNLAPLQQPG